MRHEIKKYYEEHFGEFTMLTGNEFSELRSYNLSLFPKSCLLYLKSGYRHTSKEELLSHDVLGVVLQKAINLSIN